MFTVLDPTLKILLLEEEGQTDAHSIRDELERAHYSVSWSQVDTKAGLLAQLEDEPDVILADFSFVKNGSALALALVRDETIDIPLIVLGDEVGAEAAVECIKLGATDFVLRSRLERLPSVIDRALSEQRDRALARAEHKDRDREVSDAALIQDVTARIRAEHAQTETEQRFRSLFENNPDGVYSLDLQGHFTSGNAACTGLSGYDRNELMGAHWSLLARPQDMELVTEKVVAALRGTPQNYESVVIAKDGSQIDVAITNLPMIVGGEVVGVYGICKNITKPKRAEAERFRLAATLEATTDYVAVLDRNLSLIYVNKSARGVMGISDLFELSEDFHASLSFDYADLAEHFMTAFPQAERDGIWSGELAFAGPGGREIVMSTVILAHKDEKGTTDFYSIIARDLSEQKRMEERFRQSQKMEAVGRLAGGIAHDFNNLLVVISNYAQFLSDGFEEGDSRKDDAFEIISAGERAANLVRQLLAFARKEVVKPEVVDVNDTFADLEKLLRRTIGEDIALGFEPAAELWEVEIDPGNLDQVIMNLAINSRDAMPMGGTLSVSTMNLPGEVQPDGEKDDSLRGDYVRLRVVDDGLGIADDVVDKIFEPFFTTKSQEAGTGLGLATVYGIVSHAGGHVVVDTELGRGTTFDVYLPRATCEADIKTEATIRLPRGGGGRVLVVEDEPSVANAIKRILSTGGYTVTVASGPREALEIVSAGRFKIDLILTDLVMPDMSGVELAERLVAMLPNSKVVFMSGYSDDVVARTGFVRNEVPFLHKPFNSNKLLDAIEGAMN